MTARTARFAARSDRRRFGRSLAALATGGLLLSGLSVLAATPASAATIGNIGKAVADDGAKVTGETIIDSHTVDLSISSPAVGQTSVRLLLPKDWSTSPSLLWPTLYLLHGANDVQDYKAWTAYTDVESFMADKNVLTVMPSDGPAGCYTDQYNPFGLPGTKKWETYHTTELPQIIQRGYRSNNVNAAAGISLGGYGGLIYAARHPGLYKAVASYSGLTNILDLSALLGITKLRLDTGDISSPWGSLILNRANWVAHNPQDQAAKLKGTALYVSSGDGKPGPLDDPNFKDIAASRVIEQFSGEMSAQFVQKLRSLGIPVTAHLYTGGYHYWNYWQRELRTSWPVLAGALGAPTAAAAPAPAVVSAPKSWWHAIFG
jgi:S-formylglutathione hydrolase FrmB